MHYDLATIGTIVDKHNRDVPGYRIGDGQLFDRLADALGVKGGTIYGLLADARAILTADYDRAVKAAADRVCPPGHPVERMIG